MSHSRGQLGTDRGNDSRGQPGTAGETTGVARPANFRAYIDRATAAKVQKLLREELAGSTVITIAHRLEAVEDANWCLRLEHGQVKGCGPAKGLKSR